MSKIVISRDFLETLSVFYVKTTKDEHFEISNVENGYVLKDITHLVLEIEVSDYLSALISQKNYEKIMNGGVASTWANDAGIGKGAHFAFLKKSETGYRLSKGKIEQCYHEISFGSMTLRFQLFDFSGEKTALDDLLNRSFALNTSAGQYEFVFDGTRLLFEGHHVLRIYSIVEKEETVKWGDGTTIVIDTSNTALYLNKPFLIFWTDDQKVQMSLVGDPLVSVTTIT